MVKKYESLAHICVEGVVLVRSDERERYGKKGTISKHGDLKQRIAVYIPIKDDAIDRKLAEFINNYPERSKLKIMFMRETEGVYQFGSKRVYIKVEKGGFPPRYTINTLLPPQRSIFDPKVARMLKM